MMNANKVYLIDTGFLTLAQSFSGNKGKVLENAAAIEFFRRRREFYYYRRKKECAFILKRESRAEMAVQVCCSLETYNEEREFKGLSEAMESFDIHKGIVLTYQQEEVCRYKGREIRVVPLWKYLLHHA